jgi:hypothetical protein
MSRKTVDDIRVAHEMVASVNLLERIRETERSLVADEVWRDVSRVVSNARRLVSSQIQAESRHG